MHPIDALGRPAAALTVAYLAYRFAKGFAMSAWRAWRDDAEVRHHRRALHRHRRAMRALDAAEDALVERLVGRGLTTTPKRRGQPEPLTKGVIVGRGRPPTVPPPKRPRPLP